MTTTPEILEGDQSLPLPVRIHQPGESSMTLARALLVAGLLAAPLALAAVFPWAWGSMSLLALVLLVLWARAQAQRGWLKLAWSPLLLPGLLFLAVGVVQFCVGTPLDAASSRESLLKLATYLLLFFLAAQLFLRLSRPAWRAVLVVVSIWMFAVSLLGILQHLSSGGLIYWFVRTASDSPFGPYANRNHYAGLMEMLIPLSVAGILGRRGRSPSRGFLLFTVVIALSSVLLSGSRGGFIALLVEGAILTAILSRRRPGNRTRYALVVVLFVVVAAGVLFLAVDSGPTAKRLATVADLSTRPEATFADRWLVNKDSLRMFSEHPWLGVGLGGFAFAYPRYQSFATDLLWEHAHNDYLEALVETGLTGGVLVAIALAMFFSLAFRDIDRRLESETEWYRLGAAIGCCGLLVHSLSDFNLHIPANAAWFAVCAAWAACGVGDESSSRDGDSAALA